MARNGEFTNASEVYEALQAGVKRLIRALQRRGFRPNSVAATVKE
jgi:hypothetical protein